MAGLLPKFDPEGEGYDYETAHKYKMKSKVQADGKPHWESRAPNGQMLKGRKHKTWHKLEAGERKAGYRIYKGKDGKYYSKPGHIK